MQEHFDNNQIRNNVGIVNDLLNDEEENLKANLEIKPIITRTAGENVETTSESGWKADLTPETTLRT